MNDAKISLILSTKDRADQLKLCLDHIAQIHSRIPWELIVIDNGSTDHTAGVLEIFAASVSFSVIRLYEARRGRSYGLNEALRISNGEIVAFVDDDCYVTPDHIDQVAKVFTDQKIGFAGGRVELFDPTDYPMTIATSTEMKLFPPFSVIPGGEMLGANMMFRRSVINEVGGFDVDFGPGTPLVADDTDVLIRASFSGWWGVYTPDAVVAHHHGRKAKDAVALARKYCNGSGALNLKFVLMRKTRLHFLKACYWYFLGIARRKYPIKTLFWEIEGAARYCAKRARRYLLPAT